MLLRISTVLPFVTKIQRHFVFSTMMSRLHSSDITSCSSTFRQVKHIHHHHHRVARPWQDIAISTRFCHLERSYARFHAELRPRLCCWRSSSIVQSQVHLDRPGGDASPRAEVKNMSTSCVMTSCQYNCILHTREKTGCQLLWSTTPL